MIDPIPTWLEALARGFTAELLEHLSDSIVIDDPREGRVAGTEPVHRYLLDAHIWLASLGARAELVRVTAAARYAAGEWVLHLRAGSELPVAIAFEADAQDLVHWVRVYHSSCPIEGAHRLRRRLLPAREDIALRPPVDAYQRALAAGDLEAVLACFEPDAYAREPAGAPHVHRGRKGLRAFYGALFAGGGGIPLEHCRAIDDGVACAHEYTVVRWGRAELSPQAGIAVYERGASGRLTAARIYDDVDPPTGSSPPTRPVRRQA